MEATRDKEGNVDMGLIEAFKQSQTGKTSQIVDKFLEKYKREQGKQRRRAQAASKARSRGRKYLDVS